MKKFLLLTSFLMSFGFTFSQIAKVEIVENCLLIYDNLNRKIGSICDENQSYFNTAGFGMGMSYKGHNKRYIIRRVAVDGSFRLKIYDQSKDTGKFITVEYEDEVVSVTENAILLREVKCNCVKYYDFTGKYTGKSEPIK